MDLIYCATPSRMTDKTEEMIDFAQSLGYAPFHPFLAFPHQRFEGNPAVGREKTMEICQKAINICDKFGLFGISEGTVVYELSYVLWVNTYPTVPARIMPIEFFFQKFDPQWQEMLEKIEKEHHLEHLTINPIKYIRERLEKGE